MLRSLLVGKVPGTLPSWQSKIASISSKGLKLLESSLLVDMMGSSMVIPRFVIVVGFLPTREKCCRERVPEWAKSEGEVASTSTGISSERVYQAMMDWSSEAFKISSCKRRKALVPSP